MPVTPKEPKSKDLIVSYAVDPATSAHVDDRVKSALEEGYRVVDVISTPSGNFVAVTVVLSFVQGINDQLRYYYRAK